MTPDTRRSALLAGVVVVLVCVSAWLYVGYLRPRSDAVLATHAVQGLAGSFAKREARTPVTEDDFATQLQESLFIDSAAAPRVRATEAIARGGIAYRASLHVARIRQGGETTITVAAVPGGSDALAAFPDLRSQIVSIRGQDVFRDATATIDFLVKAGRDEVAKAGQLIEEQYGSSGLALENALHPDIKSVP